MMEYAQPFLNIVRERHQLHVLAPGSDSVHYELVYATQHPLDEWAVERVLQIFHIIRNFSFIEPSVPLFVQHNLVMQFLLCGLQSFPILRLPEIQRYALDSLENVAHHLRPRSPRDPLLVELKSLLFSDDKALILSALRIITRLLVIEANEPAFADVDSAMIQRLFQLIFVWDEELVSAIMDMLYHYSSLYDHVTSQIAASLRPNIVKILLKFLAWKSHRRSSPPTVAPRPMERADLVTCARWYAALLLS